MRIPTLARNLPLFLSSGLLIFTPAAAAPLGDALLDPSGRHGIALHLEGGSLRYEVFRQDGDRRIAVLDASPLGLDVTDRDFRSGFEFVSADSIERIAESYPLVTGKAREVTDLAHQQTFTLRSRDGDRLTVTLRAMPDGVAFRYGLPDADATSPLELRGEDTGFRLAHSGRAWLLPYDHVGVWAPSYEAPWQNGIPIGTAAPADSAGWSFPALFHSGPNWVLLSEAGMDGTSYGAHLEGAAPDRLYRVRLPETAETYGVAAREVVVNRPWNSPWRFIVSGDTPAPIVTTHQPSHLSAPCAIADSSWIKPGRVSWSWWSDKSSPSDYNRLVPFIDLSADLGWEYALINLGWENMQNGSIEQLVDYARRRGVGLILWYNSGGPHNEVYAGRRDLMHIRETRRTEMAWLQRLGVKGIKVDFMQSDKAAIMQLYLDILADAADHRLLVDFHGSTIPRGWSRTYPNLMTMEAVRGAEQYWDPAFADHAHTFHTIYPFTRNAIGSMDYTPVIFGDAPELQPHRTTHAHELALAVAFESGLQHFVDSVSAYRAQPAAVQSFLATVPVVWDETRYVAGEPGRLAVLARRLGPVWYVAALNGLDTAQPVNIPLDFLPAGAHEGQTFTDGGMPREFTLETGRWHAGDTLQFDLKPRGGATVVLRPSQP